MALIVLGVLVVVAAVITIHDSGRSSSAAAGGTGVTRPRSSAPPPGGSTHRTGTPSSAGRTGSGPSTSHNTGHGTSTKPTGATSGKSTPTASSSAPRSGSSAPGGTTVDADAKKIPLIVLNNTTVPGLATEAAASLRKDGWKVTSVGNLVNDIVSTCAYYDPSSAGAQNAAKALQREYPTIKRVEPRFSQLPTGPVVLVLTPGYSPI